jgi:general nucleoside transport system permease protein
VGLAEAPDAPDRAAHRKPGEGCGVSTLDAALGRPALLLSARRLGVLGIGLGILAFWFTLPPVMSRSVAVPIVLAAAAVAIGGWTVWQGQRRIGFGAVAAGVLGGLLGLFATHTGVAHLDLVVVWGALVAAMLRYATPLTFAAIGGMFSERSGVVNIGLEGMMLTGAFFSIWADAETGSWAIGILVGAAAGGLLALLHAFFAINLRVDQIVGGTAVNFLALGITGYLFIQVYGDQGTPGSISQIPDVRLHLDSIPPKRFGHFLDDAVGQLNLMIWISFAVILLSYVVMFRTPIGLRIRSVGEHPRAADTVGISVYRVRYGAVVLSGVLSALGGAYLTLGFVHSFNENMTNGRGFIALAALIFGKWRPFGAFGAALLFGFSSAIADRLALAWGTSWQTLFQALPYLLTLIAVAGVIGRSIPPAAVGRPYKKQ